MTERIESSELLTELHRLADKLDKTPTARDMKNEGKFSTSGYYRTFGSWNDALSAAGLTKNHSYSLSRQELLDSLRTVAESLGYSPTKEDYQRLGAHSANPYYREFESWNQALREANLEVNHHRDATRKELLAEIVRLASDNRPPGRIQMAQDGKYSPQAYYTEFGSWVTAVEEAGFTPRAYAPGTRREYHYGDGWTERKRESVRGRDDHECQHCGMTEKAHLNQFGERLHVHHLVAANSFESNEHRNDSRNLVSLCRFHHRTWEAADDYCPLEQSLPEGCNPAEVDPYVNANNS